VFLSAFFELCVHDDTAIVRECGAQKKKSLIRLKRALSCFGSPDIRAHPDFAHVRRSDRPHMNRPQEGPTDGFVKAVVSIPVDLGPGVRSLSKALQVRSESGRHVEYP
jgi:hypothetical protein